MSVNVCVDNLPAIMTPGGRVPFPTLCWRGKLAKAHMAVQTVFWPSCIMDRPVFDQLAVAAAGGFDALAIAPMAIKNALASGLSLRDLRERAQELGVIFSHLDGISGWLPAWHPIEGDPIFNDYIRQRFNIDTQEALDLGAELDIAAIVAVGAFDRGMLDRETVLRGFADICAAAQTRGMRTALEFIPFWGIPEFVDAWDIVSTVGHAGSGLVLDTWHMQRGSTDFDRDLACLDAMPDDCPFDIQLADALPGTAWKELLPDTNYRGFPGDGSLDIARMVSPVMDRGALRSIGPEVFGEAVSALPLEALGRRSGETTRRALADAGANA